MVGGMQRGAELVVLDTGALATLRVTVLRHSDDMDFENAGSSVPNYLGPAVISPDGTSAWVPSKKDNVKRGTLRSSGNLNHQNTVAAISSRIDLATNSEIYADRIDHDNASLASTAAFEPYGVFLFVALEPAGRSRSSMRTIGRISCGQSGVRRRDWPCRPTGLACTSAISWTARWACTTCRN